MHSLLQERLTKPKSATNCLHSLHGHLSVFHVLINFLNSTIVFEFLISSGTNDHIFGPRNVNVSLPYLSVYMVLDLSVNFAEEGRTYRDLVSSSIL